MDLIRIVDFEVNYRVGVTEEERAKPQRLLVSLEMWLMLDRAIAHDDLAGTVDYTKVAHLLKELGKGRSWKLIESVAAEIAETVLDRFKIRKVRVEVKKFSLPEARYVSVEVDREA